MGDALYVGLISGTSADGIDAALIAFDADVDGPVRLLTGRTFEYPSDLRESVLALADPGARVDLDRFGEIDARLGEQFAQAALALLAEAGVSASQVLAIGSHGQTVRHRPSGRYPFSMQLGDPSRIAEITGITTVADFRRRDVAAGGQGAPLAPAFHRAVLGCPDEDRAVLNLGGIANVTLLPRSGPTLGFDTGPANALMDLWVADRCGLPFDRDGLLASAGTVVPDLLADLLADPWFARSGPKSTGREHFCAEWLWSRLADRARCLSDADVQATLCALTARTVADALGRDFPECTRLLLCGGGSHNPVLARMLTELLPAVRVESIRRHGLDPDLIEAMIFAWLAGQTLAGRAGNLPSVTGAGGERVLGAIHPGHQAARDRSQR